MTNPNTQSTHRFFPTMTNQVSDPISNNVERVLVRNTATGFEQGIAATAGFLTAGPLGALASWGVIRGVQGKWTPWVILGYPAAPVLGLVQLVTLGAIGGALSPDVNTDIDVNPLLLSRSTTTPLAPLCPPIMPPIAAAPPSSKSALL